MTNNFGLSQGDIETIERLINKNADDIAVSISRSFERLEERVDIMESRTYSRIAEVEDRIESARQDLSDRLDAVQDSQRAGI